MIVNILVAVLLFFAATPSAGQVSADTDTRDLSCEQPPAGATLIHFSRVDAGVYKGSKPRSDADYRLLQSLHVRYVVDLQVIPLVYWWEKRKAKRYGIGLIPGRMNASPISPSEKHIETILAILRDERYHPVYFHCALGRDRTSLIAALYKMYFLGMPPQDALRYLHESGYKDGWVRSGLERYFETHPTPPAALLSRQFLPASDNHVYVLRVQLQTAAHAPGHLGCHQCRVELVEDLFCRYRVKTAALYIDHRSPIYHELRASASFGILDPLMQTKVNVWGVLKNLLQQQISELHNERV